MRYGTRSTGPHAWDIGNVSNGFDTLVEQVLEQNGIESDDIGRDEANDVAVGLGIDFSDDEYQDFMNLRNTVDSALERGTPWALSPKHGRGEIMTQAGEAVRSDEEVNFTLYRRSSEGLEADVSLTYDDSQVDASIILTEDEGDVPFKIQRLLSESNSPSPEDVYEIPAQAVNQVDYEEVFRSEYKDLISDQVGNDNVEKVEINQDGTVEAEITASQVQSEDLKSMLGSLNSATKDIAELNGRATWNMVASSPYRDDEYGMAG